VSGVFSRISVFLMGVTCAARILGCGSGDRKSQIQADQEKISGTLGAEISLKEDREKLAELRKEIPEDQQDANDELAQMTKLMAAPTTNPSRFREQYQRLTQKKRKTFQNKVKKLRTDFTKEERDR